MASDHFIQELNSAIRTTFGWFWESSELTSLCVKPGRDQRPRFAFGGVAQRIKNPLH
jgi:hypothetical protein